jgi:phospholipid transport system transporter-binding protein
MTVPQMLVENRDGALHLRGPLVFASVGVALTQSLALLPRQGVAVIDMSEVEQADSAALALLIEWRKFAARQGLRLEVQGVPAQLRALAAAAGLEALCA